MKEEHVTAYLLLRVVSDLVVFVIYVIFRLDHKVRS